MVDALKPLRDHTKSVFGLSQASHAQNHTNTPTHTHFLMVAIERTKTNAIQHECSVLKVTIAEVDHTIIGPTTEHKIKTLIQFYSTIINHGSNNFKCRDWFFIRFLNILSLR